MTLNKTKILFTVLFGANISVASAFTFDWGDVEGRADIQLSAGATFRGENIDYSLVSKRNHPNYHGMVPGDEVLCADAQTGGDPTIESPAISLPGGTNIDEDLLGGCLLNAAEHQELVLAQGRFSQNGDQGNLNYDKGDVVAAAFKTTTDLSLDWNNFSFFSRVISFYDPSANNVANRNFDQIQQPAQTARSKAVLDDIGFQIELEDLYLSSNWDIGDRTLSVALGDQTISWGESLTFVVNSINSINAPNLIRLYTPGMDLKEIFNPTSMLTAAIDLSDNWALETFYQLDWEPIQLMPVGSFFSTADVAGTGAKYVMLSSSKEPEDPSNIQDDAPNDFAQSARGCINQDPEIYLRQISDRNGNGVVGEAADFAYGNANNPRGQVGDRYAEFGAYQAERQLLGEDGNQAAGRTFCRTPDIEPEDKGQWGVKLNYYAEWLNDTEFGFYFSNTHSRLPYASFVATDINDTAGQHSLHPIFSNAFLIGNDHSGENGLDGSSVDEDDADLLGALTRADTMALSLEYPEDIQMYGISFNTTVGDLSVSGEVAYRPNLPVQISPFDMVLYALGPAFGQGRDVAGKSYVEAYRHGEGLSYNDYWEQNDGRGPLGIYQSNRNPLDPTNGQNGADAGYTYVGTPVIEAGQLLHGYERLEVANVSTTLLYATSVNPFGADQWLIIGDIAATKVFGMPSKDELQFGIASEDGWYGEGRAQRDERTVGSLGQPCNTVTNVFYDALTSPQIHLDCVNGLLNQAPKTMPSDMYAGSFSWGFRVLTFLDYKNVLFGANLRQLFGVFWDVNGNSPGPGGNFIEGRKRYLLGSEFDLSDWKVAFRYNWFTGAGQKNLDADRDHYSISFNYNF